MTREIFGNVEPFMHYIKWVAALVSALWGGVPDLTRLLFVLMVIDTLFGLTVAIKERSLSSSMAWSGVTKKLGTLGMVVVAALLGPYNPIPEISLVQAASAFYTVPELLSIARNAAILHIPVFSQFSGVLRYFQGISGHREEDKDEVRKLP